MKKIKEYSDLSKAEKQQALDAMINLFLAKILDGEFGYDEDDFEESGLDDVQRIVVTQVLEAQEKAEKLSTPFYFLDFFVEFVLSLDYNKDEDCLVIPFSIRDNDTYFCKLKLNNIEWMDICGNDIDSKICSSSCSCSCSF
jgi:hypothetical protein